MPTPAQGERAEGRGARGHEPVRLCLLRVLAASGLGGGCLAFSPDGRLLAAAAGSDVIRLWEVGSGTLLHAFPNRDDTVPVPLNYLIPWVAFSPDGSLLAAAGHHLVSGVPTGTIRLWDPRSGDLVRKISEREEDGVPVAFSGDGGLLASQHRGGIRLWSPRTGDLLRSLTGCGSAEFVFGPDGRMLVVGGSEGQVELWDVDRGILDRTLVGPGVPNEYPDRDRVWLEDCGGPMSQIAVSRDGRFLARVLLDSCSFLTATVELRDLESGAPRRFLALGERRRIFALAFSPDGSLLAGCVGVGGRDGQEITRLWATESGEAVGVVPAAARGSGSLAFSPDGRLLASGHSDGVRLWSVDGVDGDGGGV